MDLFIYQKPEAILSSCVLCCTHSWENNIFCKLLPLFLVCRVCRHLHHCLLAPHNLLQRWSEHSSQLMIFLPKDPNIIGKQTVTNKMLINIGHTLSFHVVLYSSWLRKVNQQGERYLYKQAADVCCNSDVLGGSVYFFHFPPTQWFPTRVLWHPTVP